MRTKFSLLFLAPVLVVSLCIACGSREKEANLMLIQTTPLLKTGNLIEVKEHLNKIISKYPETKAASAATVMLDDMVDSANRIAESTLRTAWAASVTYLRCYPNEKVDMTKLRDEFGFRNIEGVEIEIVRSGADNLLITSKHVAGDRLYSVSRNGGIEYEEL